MERLKETKLLDFGAEKEKENAGGALEAPKVKKVKSVVDDYVDEQRTDQYFNFAMKSVGVEREGLSTAQDYDSCPKLEGQLPNVGTKIAYKVLEVEGGCPMLSDYRKVSQLTLAIFSCASVYSSCSLFLSSSFFAFFPLGCGSRCERGNQKDCCTR